MKKHPRPTRASVLHAVIEEIQARNDGQIPTDVDGIDAFFHDTGDLADALLLRWHTRLTASLEGGLVGDPESRREAVIEAWRHCAQTYRGVRMVIDQLVADPPTEAIDNAVRTTTSNDWAAMAVAAGLASDLTMQPPGSAGASNSKPAAVTSSSNHTLAKARHHKTAARWPGSRRCSSADVTAGGGAVLQEPEVVRLVPPTATTTPS